MLALSIQLEEHLFVMFKLYYLFNDLLWAEHFIAELLAKERRDCFIFDICCIQR